MNLCACLSEHFGIMATHEQPPQRPPLQGFARRLDGICDELRIWDGDCPEVSWLVLGHRQQVVRLQTEPVLAVRGSRRGVPQICGLMWSAVDLDAGEITIHDSRVVVGGHTQDKAGGKTRNADKTISIDRTTLVVNDRLMRMPRKVPGHQEFVSVCITMTHVGDDRFDLDLLDDEDPFEIDAQAAHLFKHPRLGIEDIRDVWAANPMFYPAKPPAHWLMVAEVEVTILMVPPAPARDGNPNAVAPSAATPPPNTSLTDTGVTDEPAHDPRRGIRVLHPPRKPGTPRARATPAHRHRARAVPTRTAGAGARGRGCRRPLRLVLDSPRSRARASPSRLNVVTGIGARSEGSSLLPTD